MKELNFLYQYITDDNHINRSQNTPYLLVSVISGTKNIITNDLTLLGSIIITFTT